MPKVLLTEEIVDGLEAAEPIDRTEYCDQRVPGMYIRQKSCFLRFKWAGRTAHVKINRIADIALEDAREKALEFKAMVKQGIDPREETRRDKRVLTFRVFMEDSYFPFAKKRKKTWADDADLCRLRLYDRFGNTPLDRIKRHDIELLQTDLRDSGLAGATCDHYIRLLKRVFKLAVEWDLLEKSPCTGVKLFLEPNQVNHYLNDDQLRQLMSVLLSPVYRKTNVSLVARLLLATGARLNEALSAQWNNFNRETRVWNVPAVNSKSKKVRTIPLTDAALQVLDELDTEGEYPWLFVNRVKGKRLEHVHRVFGQLRVKAGLPWLRIHDLRHSYASFLVGAGRTLYEVQSALGHSSPVVTQRYAHLSAESLQEASSTASDKIMAAMDSVA